MAKKAAENRQAIDLARALWNRIDQFDGCGLVVTDADLLAEEIAEAFGIDPHDVWDDYGE